MKKPPHSAFASVIGYRAEELCRRSASGTIIGATSSGVFILGKDQLVLFLSFPNIPGPWTIIFSTPPSGLQTAAPGMKVIFLDGIIQIEEISLSINLSIADIWQTPPRPNSILPQENIINNLQKATTDYLAAKEPDGLTPLLPVLLSTNTEFTLGNTQRSAWELLQKIQSALQARNCDGLLQSLSPLFGQGRGLTPAGDDCITGLLLGLIRSSINLFSHQDMDQMKNGITKLAFERTTALSASQIEAAAEGSADMRIITALDGLLTGNVQSEECAMLLGDYGHSSGGDILVGFTLALINPVI